MTWQSLIVISLLSGSTSRLLQCALLQAKSSQPIAFAMINQFIIGFTLLVFGLLTHKPSIPPISPIITSIVTDSLTTHNQPQLFSALPLPAYIL